MMSSELPLSSLDVVVYESEGVEESPSKISDEKELASRISITEHDTPKKANENDVIIYEGVNDAMDAFEVFQGRVFLGNNNKKKFDGEKPLHKCSRLLAEVSALEKELAISSKIEKSDDLMRVAAEISNRLNRISCIPTCSQELTNKIQEEVKNIGKVEIIEPSSSAVDLTTTWHLSLENRLKVLEKMIGTSLKNAQNDSILKRVEEMEGKVKNMDEKKIDVLALRAKVIRSDLEAAAKARSKLSYNISSSEDSKIISSLYDQLLSLEEVSGQLPSIVQRLEQLSVLHNQATGFSSRLLGVERDVLQLERTVCHAEQAFSKVENGCKDNLVRLEKFMEQMDIRLNKLEGS